MFMMIKLALKNIRENKKWAFMTVIGISISIMLITMVVSFAVGSYQSLSRELLASSETWNVSYSIDNSNGDVTRKDLYEFLEGVPSIQRFNVSFTYGYADTGEEFGLRGFHNHYLIPEDAQSATRLSYSVAGLEHGRYPSNESEIAIGYKYIENPVLGESIEIDFVDGNTEKFTIVGVMETNDSVLVEQDISKLMSATVSVEFKDGIAFDEQVGFIRDEIKADHVSYNSLVNNLRGFAKSANKLLKAAIGLATILISIISLSSISLIYNAFYLSLEQKVQQIGLLKSIGATKKQISMMVYFEGLILTLISITIGIVGGYLLALGSLEYISTAFSILADELYRFNPVLTLPTIGIIYVIGLLTVVFPILKSVRYSHKISPIETIRNISNKDDVRKAKPVPLIVEKYLKTSGVLANKNYYRDRKKHRSTGIALIITIVLFITITSFVDYAKSTIDITNTNPYDVRFGTYREEPQMFEDYFDIVGRLNDKYGYDTIITYSEKDTFASGVDQNDKDSMLIQLPLGKAFKQYSKNKPHFEESVIMLTDEEFEFHFGEVNLDKTVYKNTVKGKTQIEKKQ